MKTHSYSSEEFKEFKKCVTKDMKRLGLTGWDCEIQRKQLSNGVCARIYFDVVSKSTVIYLTKTVEYALVVDKDVKQHALHEVLHLLLADYCWTAATGGNHCADAVIAKEHELINRLMGVL